MIQCTQTKCSVIQLTSLFQFLFRSSQKPTKMFSYSNPPPYKTPKHLFKARSSPRTDGAACWSLEHSLIMTRHGNVACCCLKHSLTMTRQDAETAELSRQQDRKAAMLRAARGSYNGSRFPVRRKNFSITNYLTCTSRIPTNDINLPLPPPPIQILAPPLLRTRHKSNRYRAPHQLLPESLECNVCVVILCTSQQWFAIAEKKKRRRRNQIRHTAYSIIKTPHFTSLHACNR